jgi:hypothetical protein
VQDWTYEKGKAQGEFHKDQQALEKPRRIRVQADHKVNNGSNDDGGDQT